MVVSMRMAVFWVVMPCSLGRGLAIFKKSLLPLSLSP
jgi:hypothetical protein